MAEPTIQLERDGTVGQGRALEPAAQPVHRHRLRRADGVPRPRSRAPTPAALVWRAEGEIFTGGVDVNAFQRIVDAESPDAASGLAGPLIERACSGSRRSRSRRSRLIHGLCLTAGLEIALGCDIIWAEESAKFGLVEAVVGLTPGAGGTQRMAERAGPGRAREFVMTGGLYDARDARALGTSINRVVGDGEVEEKGMRFAERLGAAARPRPTRRRSGSCAPTSTAASSAPTRSPRVSSPSCSRPRTCRARSGRSLRRARESHFRG